MIDKSQRNLLGRFRELILRWFYAFKYLVKSWIRIPRDAPFWMKGMLLTIYIFAFFLIFLLAVDVNLFWLFGSSPKIKEIKNPEINLTSEIYSSDEGTKNDIPKWCQKMSHEFLGIVEEDSYSRLFLRKA